jgi:glyoxylase-like metal-dependent hydrolase (beta-lactamase superfamily II)
MPAEIRLFPCRSDNYGVLLHDPASGATASIDAPEAAPIEAALKATGWKLTDILVTHHHADHTGASPNSRATVVASPPPRRGRASRWSMRPCARTTRCASAGWKDAY